MYKPYGVVFLAACAVPAAASASTVSVIVINDSAEKVTFQPISKNEHNTAIHAAPQVAQVVESHRQAMFHVAPYITQDVNFAAVRYRSQTRQCAFLTSYVNTYTRGMRIPKWNHSATGKAGCTSRIVRADPVSHDWTVEFRIR
jgi:hypothetical protein